MAEASAISFKPVDGNIPALVDENGDALSDEEAGKVIVQNSQNHTDYTNLKRVVLALGVAAGGFLGKNEYGKRTTLSTLKGVAIGATVSVLLCKAGPILAKKAPELPADIKAGIKYADEQKQQGNSGVNKFTSILTNIKYDGQPCSANDYDPDL